MPCTAPRSSARDDDFGAVVVGSSAYGSAGAGFGSSAYGSVGPEGCGLGSSAYGSTGCAATGAAHNKAISASFLIVGLGPLGSGSSREVPPRLALRASRDRRR